MTILPSYIDNPSKFSYNIDIKVKGGVSIEQFDLSFVAFDIQRKEKI